MLSTTLFATLLMASTGALAKPEQKNLVAPTTQLCPCGPAPYEGGDDSHGHDAGHEDHNRYEHDTGLGNYGSHGGDNGYGGHAGYSGEGYGSHRGLGGYGGYAAHGGLGGYGGYAAHGGLGGYGGYGAHGGLGGYGGYGSGIGIHRADNHYMSSVMAAYQSLVQRLSQLRIALFDKSCTRESFAQEFREVYSLFRSAFKGIKQCGVCHNNITSFTWYFRQFFSCFQQIVQHAVTMWGSEFISIMSSFKEMNSMFAKFFQYTHSLNLQFSSFLDGGFPKSLQSCGFNKAFDQLTQLGFN